MVVIVATSMRYTVRSTVVRGNACCISCNNTETEDDDEEETSSSSSSKVSESNCAHSAKSSYRQSRIPKIVRVVFFFVVFDVVVGVGVGVVVGVVKRRVSTVSSSSLDEDTATGRHKLLIAQDGWCLNHPVLVVLFLVEKASQPHRENEETEEEGQDNL